MTDRPTVDERIARWFEEEGSAEMPGRVLDAAFTRTRSLPQRRPGRAARLVLRRWRTPLLVAAGLVLAGAATAIVGSQLAVERGPDLLTRLREAGVVQVAVRPDHPQVIGANAGLAGFDIDVANELGRRLGLRTDIQPVAATDMLGSDTEPAADLMFPSLGTSASDPARFARSVPYYWWPHYLVVSAASGRSDSGDLAGQAICAVEGDMGESWLRGEGDSVPIDGSVVVTRASDAECLAALADGTVAGLVTAHMGPADLAARPTLAVLRGPPAEPRAVIAALSSGPGALMAEVDITIGELLADGTLTQLSKNRFGGYDLSRSPAQ
jgi:polar amino acid transport system substrate-binding protein